MDRTREMSGIRGYHRRIPDISLERYYGDQPGNVDELWMFPDTNFAKLAEDMGAFGIRIDQPSQIQPAIEEALASGKPAVIDVVSDIEGIAPRAWTP